jgi:hypothetical protein
MVICVVALVWISLLVLLSCRLAANHFSTPYTRRYHIERLLRLSENRKPIKIIVSLHEAKQFDINDSPTFSPD